MRGTITVLLFAASIAVHAAPQSQSYDDYVKNVSWKHDDAILVPKGVKIAPSRQIDMAKNPFKKDQKRLKIVQKKLRKARKKMEHKFKRSGTTLKETFQHGQLREQEKLAKKQLARRFNILCAAEVPRLEKLNFLIRDLKNKIEKASGKEKENLHSIQKKYIAEAQSLIQNWVDNVFVYCPYPKSDTWDNKLYPNLYRNLYIKVSAAVQKAIKKGGFAVAEDEQEEDEEETGSEYTKKYTELTKDFLSEHFDVSASDKFNPKNNPFKAEHSRRVALLDKLTKLQAKNDTHDMKNRGGQRRETFEHERMREDTKESGRMISRKFHSLLYRDFVQFEKHVNQIRRWIRVMEQNEGKPQATYAEKQYQRHVKAGTKVLQKMVDEVFAHEPFPPTPDYQINTRFRNFYRDASKLFYEG